MTDEFVLHLTSKAMLMVLLLSMPAIIVAALTGVVISLLQAVTQIQEQTLSFAIKLIAVTVTLLITARWAGSRLYQLTIQIMDNLAG